MFVWNDVAQRYCGLPRFPFSGPGVSRVWNADRDPRMPEHERIVLLSTMDYAVVLGSDAQAVADAFARYGKEHPASSYREQADILRSADIQPDDLIAWQQTSVGEFWGSRWDDTAEATVWYDPAEGSHFDVYASRDRATREKEHDPQEQEDA